MYILINKKWIIFSFSFHTDNSRILKPVLSELEEDKLIRSINIEYSMYTFILLYECILSYGKTCKWSNNGWNSLFWSLSLKLPSRILDMFIQSRIVGLVSLLSSVPIFFSQKADKWFRLGALWSWWVLFFFFFFLELKLKKLYWQVQISVDQKQSQFLSKALKTKNAEFYSALFTYS